MDEDTLKIVRNILSRLLFNQGNTQKQSQLRNKKQQILVQKRNKPRQINNFRMDRIPAEKSIQNCASRCHFIKKQLFLTINRSCLKLSYNKTQMKGKEVKKIGSKSSKKGIYNNYSFDARKKLISMVEDDNRTLASSAKELGICQTTARLIISTWREEGRVFEKKTDKEKRMKRQAKRQARAQRKIKSQRQQRSEIEQGVSREEVPNVASSQKPVEFEQSIVNQQISEDVVQPQIAENSAPFHQHLLQTSIPYQFVEFQGVYYLQIPYDMPTHFGWF